MEEDYVKWDRRFELGIPTIDEQHKKLVSICNGLYKAIMRRSKSSAQGLDSALEETLHECVQYVQSHFSAEETLMKEAGYLRFDEHKKRHEVFIKKILETARGFGTSNVQQSIQFVRFIYDWIVEHVAYEDKLYVQDIQKLNTKVIEQSRID